MDNRRPHIRKCNGNWIVTCKNFGGVYPTFEDACVIAKVAYDIYA